MQLTWCYMCANPSWISFLIRHFMVQNLFIVFRQNDTCTQDVSAEERTAMVGNLEPLMQLAGQHLGGREAYARR